MVVDVGGKGMVLVQQGRLEILGGLGNVPHELGVFALAMP